MKRFFQQKFLLAHIAAAVVLGVVFLAVTQEDEGKAVEAQSKENDLPELPWAEAERRNYPPGQPGKDYTPVVVPGGTTARYSVRDGVKVFHLVAEPITQEVAPGLEIKTWGYNGSVPGPVLELCEGDRVRIYVTNHLPAKTSVHWHGILLPCGMDGVSGLTQKAIMPGETFRYEFLFPDSGTFLYHPHFDSMTQEGFGLTGMIVVHERNPQEEAPDRDFSIMLHEWKIPVGASRPDPNEMTDFNVLTMNGKALPGSVPLVAGLGDKVRIRFGNLSPMDHHPIHLHGYAFKVVGTDGGWFPKEAQIPETTVLVQVGSAKVIEFVADNPGDWLMHCHMTHHTMNQMGHDFPNMVGVDSSDIDERIRQLIPNYMTMGTTGMRDMTKMDIAIPENSIPMLGADFQFGHTVLGGMSTVVKIRENPKNYDDPGPYQFPEGTVAGKATKSELQRDGIQIPSKKKK